MNRGTSFNAIKEAATSEQRLTRPQCKALLDYALMQSERAERLALQIDALTRDVAIAKEDYERLSQDWNSLVRMLDETLAIRMYCSELDSEKQPLWTIEKDGQVISKGHRSIMLAYASVLTSRESEK